MSPVLTRPPRATSPAAVATTVVLGLTVVVLFLLAVRMTADRPSFVAELTVVNPTVYKIDVEVQGDGPRRLELGSVRREQSSTYEDVIDQGARWVFRFSYGGVPGGELAVSRAQLEADEWRVVVPGDVGERLRLAGLRPSAR